jgi:hypothetical protein
MAQHMEKPAARANAGRLSLALCVVAERFENNAPQHVLQREFLRRRCGISPARAAVVASHCFGEARS